VSVKPFSLRQTADGRLAMYVLHAFQKKSTKGVGGEANARQSEH
jgi:phage-related protein